MIHISCLELSILWFLIYCPLTDLDFHIHNSRKYVVGKNVDPEYVLNSSKIKKIKPLMVTQTVIKANSETEGGGSELHNLPWQLTKTQSHKE